MGYVFTLHSKAFFSMAIYMQKLANFVFVIPQDIKIAYPKLMHKVILNNMVTQLQK